MSKRFKGKTCTYCSVAGVSDTGDHVFAREFFAKYERANLPKVPACRACNAAKSRLETYLTAVLPFGSRTSHATEMLNSMVPGRLSANPKLRQNLAEGISAMWLDENGIHRPAMGLPFDGKTLAALFRYITRGLITHHLNIVIPAHHYVGAGLLSPYGERLIGPWLSGAGRARVSQTLGNNVFRYEGLQSADEPELTIWRFEMYGGLQLAGDPCAPSELPKRVWAMSARNSIPGLFDGYEDESAFTHRHQTHGRLLSLQRSIPVWPSPISRSGYRGLEHTGLRQLLWRQLGRDRS
jgi:hypothetical protein